MICEKCGGEYDKDDFMCPYCGWPNPIVKEEKFFSFPKKAKKTEKVEKENIESTSSDKEKETKENKVAVEKKEEPAPVVEEKKISKAEMEKEEKRKEERKARIASTWYNIAKENSESKELLNDPSVKNDPRVKNYGMKYCRNCGRLISPDAYVCPHCGALIGVIPDTPNAGYAVLSFLFPPIGFILWLVWQEYMPKRANSCKIGTIVGVVLSVISFIISLIILAS